MKNKLPKAFKSKWLKALRSGKYKQGHTYLKHDGKYCCLGIACLVAGYKEMGGYSLINGPDFPKVPTILHDGLDDKVPMTLAEMNDSGKSFLEIADYIEKNL